MRNNIVLKNFRNIYKLSFFVLLKINKNQMFKHWNLNLKDTTEKLDLKNKPYSEREGKLKIDVCENVINQIDKVIKNIKIQLIVFFYKNRTLVSRLSFQIGGII